MKTLLRLTAILTALSFLPGLAQRPQGLGRDVRDAVSTPQGLVAINETEVLLSTNAGLSFQVLFTLPVAGDQLYALAARGSTVVVGGTDSILYTADLSADPIVWSPKSGTSAKLLGDVLALAASPAGTWIAAGDGGLLRSTNALDWTLELDSFDIFTSVTWVSGQIWIAVGNNGISRSTNDGDSWMQVLSGVSLLSVAADGFGNVLAVGENGAVYLSTNDGADFTLLHSGGENFHAVVSTGEKNWAIGGVQRTLLLLDDQGTLSTASVIGYEDASLDEVHGLALVDGSLLMAGVETVPPPGISATNDPLNPVPVTLVPNHVDDTVSYSTDGSEPSIPYTAPFIVTGSVTVRAVSLRNGVYSPVVSQVVEAGQFQIFQFTSISVSGGQVILQQDTSNSGVTYRLEYTLNLAANPVVWTPEDVPTQLGAGDPLTWTLTPIPSTIRIWRVIVE